MTKTKDVIQIFYEQIGEGLWKCACGSKRKEKVGQSYTNLVQYLLNEHADEYKKALAGSHATLDQFIAPVPETAKKIFGWMRFITKTLKPFSFCENPIIKEAV